MGNEILVSVSYLLLQIKTLRFHDFKTPAFILFLHLCLGCGVVRRAWFPLSSTQSGEVAPKQLRNRWDLIDSGLEANGALTGADGMTPPRVCLVSSVW